MPHQVHQTKIVKIDERLLELDDTARLEALEDTDAVMTDVPGVCIGVSTADCIPLLLFDKRRHVVCAVHAGWRGTVSGIVRETISKMQSIYGTQGKDIWAIIGPGISLEHFEVGDEVYEQFEKAGFRMGNIAKRYPCSTNSRSWKWHIDLWECNRMQIEEMGVLPEKIQVTGICTYTQYEDYFSARRLGINSGRIFTGILMK